MPKNDAALKWKPSVDLGFAASSSRSGGSGLDPAMSAMSFNSDARLLSVHSAIRANQTHVFCSLNHFGQ